MMTLNEYLEKTQQETEYRMELQEKLRAGEPCVRIYAYFLNKKADLEHAGYGVFSDEMLSLSGVISVCEGLLARESLHEAGYKSITVTKFIKTEQITKEQGPMDNKGMHHMAKEINK